MSISIRNANGPEWAGYGLPDFCEISDMIEYREQTDDSFGWGRGGWFYVTDPLRGNPGKRAIITGTYANDHSPGASHYTSAEVYDMADPEDTDAFRVECERLENLPEWADDDENDDDENDDEG